MNTNMALNKKYLILIGLVVVIFVGGILIYSGWTKQKPEPVKLQSEQIKSEVIRQVVIPSSLDSEQVIVDFVPYIRAFGSVITREDSFWTDSFGIAYPNEGFIEGGITPWQGKGNYYVKKDRTKIEGPDDPWSFVVSFAVLKYRNSKSAQEDYNRISNKQEFKDFTLKNVKLETKAGLTPAFKKLIKENSWIKLKSEQCQQYLLWSNNFIIHTSGLKEAAEDVMIRVIDRYAVE